MVLRVKDLKKSFSSLPVLNGISFDVEKGDVIAVLGPSGGGKTTMLRCLNFLEKADSGKIEFNGEEFDLSTISKKDIKRIRMQTGFVFQNYNLFSNKTALENVMEGLTVARKMKKAEAEEISLKYLEKVGMQEKASAYLF